MRGPGRGGRMLPRAPRKDSRKPRHHPRRGSEPPVTANTLLSPP